MEPDKRAHWQEEYDGNKLEYPECIAQARDYLSQMVKYAKKLNTKEDKYQEYLDELKELERLLEKIKP